MSSGLIFCSPRVTSSMTHSLGLEMIGRAARRGWPDYRPYGRAESGGGDDAPEGQAEREGSVRAIDCFEFLLRPQPLRMGGLELRLAGDSERDLAGAPIGPGPDAHQSIALKRPDGAAERGAFHHEGFRQFADRQGS